MPEDTSDDSSIPDCCRSELVTIRNTIFLHAAGRQNRSLTYQTSVPPVVHVSRPVQFLRDKTAGAAAVIARLFSAKETGPRDKILLFFSVMYQTLFQVPEAALKKGIYDPARSAGNHTANKHVRLSDFKTGSGTELTRFFVTGFSAEPVLARLAGQKQACNRIPQQKF